MTTTGTQASGWVPVPPPGARVCVQTAPNAGRVFTVLEVTSLGGAFCVRVQHGARTGWFGLALVTPAPAETDEDLNEDEAVTGALAAIAAGDEG